MMLERRPLLLLLLLVFLPNKVWSYKVPNETVEVLENGFRISIPDEPNIQYVAFNVNRNRNFTSLSQGQFSIQVRSQTRGRWSHEFLNVQLQPRDTLYVWTSVQHNQAIFSHLSEPKKVCELGGQFVPIGCPEDPKIPPNTSATEAPTESTFCEPTSTLVWPMRTSNICKGQLIFEENFNQVDETRWMHEVRAPLDTNDAEFVLYDGKTFVDNGNVVIMPKLWPDYQLEVNSTDTFLDLAERCTGTHSTQHECVLQTGGPIIMPPVVVPRLSTRESFGFKYGRIEIRAKLPKGDWMVPLLLLEPLREYYGQTGYESGQLRIAMARGNTLLRLPHGKLIDGRTLYGGAVLTNNAAQREDFMVSQHRKQHFGDEFHVYGMEWNADGLHFSVDGHGYGEILSNFFTHDLNPRWRKGGPMAPFDRLFYISLGISVGGFSDFVDRVSTANYEKPWLNRDPRARRQFWQARSNWLPTWNSEARLLVDYVRVYAN